MLDWLFSLKGRTLSLIFSMLTSISFAGVIFHYSNYSYTKNLKKKKTHLFFMGLASVCVVLVFFFFIRILMRREA